MGTFEIIRHRYKLGLFIEENWIYHYWNKLNREIITISEGARTA